MTSDSSPHAIGIETPSPLAAELQTALPLVEAVWIDRLEQLVVIGIVHLDADDDGTLTIEGTLHHWRDLISAVDRQPRGPETLRSSCEGAAAQSSSSDEARQIVK